MSSRGSIADPDPGAPADAAGTDSEPRDPAQRLLRYLREVTGDPALRFLHPPRPIGGGRSGAVIIAFELASPPPHLAGRLLLRLRPHARADIQAREVAMLDDISDAALRERYAHGLRWLREHLPADSDPRLCHGDFHNLNVMSAWRGVSGVVDWEAACIADREYDIAATHCGMTLAFGALGRALISPLYWGYFLYLRSQGPIDAARLRYYRAHRIYIVLVLGQLQHDARLSSRLHAELGALMGAG